jgi:diguanylate cyclase (GGDEF)-like protein/PAS domain S-box-containing protein
MFQNNDVHDTVYYFELFFQVFNSMSDMVFLVEVDHNKDFRYLFANEAANKNIGIKSDSYGRLISDFMPSPAFIFMKGKYEEAMSKKCSITYEDKVKLPFDRENQHLIKQKVYYESTITPVFNEDGKCTYILALVRDITKQKQKEKELKHAKEQFELLWNSTADAIYTFDEYENFVNVNDAFEELFGWERDAILSDSTISIIPNQDKRDLKHIVEAVKSGQSVPSHEVQRVTKEGRIIDVLASYSPIYNHDGIWEGAIAVYKDITERKKTSQELEESEKRYRLITEHSSDLIKVTTPEGIVLYTSPSHYYLLGVDPEECLNKSILSFVYPDDRKTIAHAMKEIVHKLRPISVEYRKFNQSGEVVWFHSIITPVLDEKNEIDRIIFVAREITERKTYEEKLKHLALYDSLTGQPNRRHFYTRIEEELDCAKQSQSIFSVMLLDLDRFKKINDTMGHDIGDQLLMGFAERVRDCLREKDFFARLGGDEFVILMPDLTEKDEAIEMANRIIHSLQKDWKFGEYRFKTTSSIGIAFYPPYELGKKELLKHADLALYQAKEKGRNNVEIYQDILVV